MCIILSFYIFFGNLSIHFHVMLGSCVDAFGHAFCSDFKDKKWCNIPEIGEYCCETCEQGEAKEEEDKTGNTIIRFSHQLD